jgi:hypothetical protein
VDRVVWLEDGHIEAVGTFRELMDGNPGFAEMMKEITTDGKEEEKIKPEGEEEIEEAEKKPKKQQKAAGKGLMQAEDRGVKSVPWKVYDAYIRASGTILMAPIIILLLIAGQTGNIITTLWLSWWISDKYGLKTGTYVCPPQHR